MPCSQTPAGLSARPGVPHVQLPRDRSVDLQRLGVAFRLLQNVGPASDQNFGALSHGLHARCLRFALTGRPVSTQDSLQVGGQPCPGKLIACWAPTRGFRVASYISSPPPELRLAQGENLAAVVPGPGLLPWTESGVVRANAPPSLSKALDSSRYGSSPDRCADEPLRFRP